MRTILFAAAVAVVVSGCATKRYGRLQPLSGVESAAYTCREIEIEIAKVEAFRMQVANGAKFNLNSVLGFLGDYGIGNANEKNAAERTATQRMNHLMAARAEKKCVQPIVAAADPIVPVPPVLPVATIPPAPPAPPAPRASVRPAPVIAPPPTTFGNGRVKCVTC